MPNPIETVRSFFAEAERPRGLAQAIRNFFKPDTVWENVGMAKTTGPDEAVGLLSGFGDAETLSMRIDLLSIATDGDKVLTERIDHILDAEGRSVMVIPVMGIFAVKDGRIETWRDYFDTAAFSSDGPTPVQA